MWAPLFFIITVWSIKIYYKVSPRNDPFATRALANTGTVASRFQSRCHSQES